MKKNLLVIFYLFFSTLNSCVAQNLSGVIQTSLRENLYAKISCKLFVKDAGENYQLIMCRSTGIAGDTYDKAFIISSETPLSKLALNSQDEYEVQIPESKKYLVIYNKSKNQVHFVGTSDMTNHINSIKSNSSLSAAITNIDCFGYGLSYLTGSWNHQKVIESQYKIPFNTLDYSNNTNPVQPQNLVESPVSCKEGICTSGGAGSTSCSITELGMSCTVSCTAGYYACCVSNTVRCYCCRIPTTQN